MIYTVVHKINDVVRYLILLKKLSQFSIETASFIIRICDFAFTIDINR